MTQRPTRALTILALPASLLLMAAPAASQWLPNGSDIYFNAGHVGIGQIPAPNVQLQVQTYKSDYGIFATNHTNTGSPHAIYGYASGTNGIGVEGLTTADDGKTYGVLGQSASVDGAGVLGQAIGKKTGVGVWGIGRGESAHGVVAEARHYGFGVQAFGTYADGVYAQSYLGHAAVHGRAYDKNSTGVYGDSQGKGGIGVYGLHGPSSLTPGPAAGVVGETNTRGTYGVFARGDFGGTGAKYFVQPHPTDPSVAVRFVCLEGNESGTYFRGTMHLQNGRAEIAIPEEWRAVSEDAGITVQVTPVRSLARLTVWERSRERIVIAGDEDCEFDYFVNGVRRGFADFEPRVANSYFRPAVRGVPFGGQYPEAMRQILVENGTLNPDFTPNENTAARLGWDLVSEKQGRHHHGDSHDTPK